MFSVLAQMSTLVALLLLGVAGVDARFHVEKANFVVRMPASIKGTYEMAIANFGTPLRRHPRVRPHPAPSSRRDLSRHDASSSHHARASRETTRPASHPPTHPPHPLSRRSGSLVYPPTDHDACYPSPCVPGPRSASRPLDDAVFVSTLSFRASSPDPSLEYSLLKPRPARLPGADS